MTRIHALSPFLFAPTNTAHANNGPLAADVTQDFPSLLSEQPKNPQTLSNPANALNQSESHVRLPRSQDPKTTLEHLVACRTMSSNIASRAGQSSPGSPATATPASNYRPNARPFVNNAGAMELTRTAENGAILRAEHIRGLIARRAGFCWSGVGDDFSAECARQNSAMAEEAPTSIIVWIPVETLRSPIQLTRSRRRRNPRSPQDHRRDEFGEKTGGPE